MDATQRINKLYEDARNTILNFDYSDIEKKYGAASKTKNELLKEMESIVFTMEYSTEKEEIIDLVDAYTDEINIMWKNVYDAYIKELNEKRIRQLIDNISNKKRIFCGKKELEELVNAETILNPNKYELFYNAQYLLDLFPKNRAVIRTIVRNYVVDFTVRAARGEKNNGYEKLLEKVLSNYKMKFRDSKYLLYYDDIDIDKVLKYSFIDKKQLFKVFKERMIELNIRYSNKYCYKYFNQILNKSEQKEFIDKAKEIIRKSNNSFGLVSFMINFKYFNDKIIKNELCQKLISILEIFNSEEIEKIVLFINDFNPELLNSNKAVFINKAIESLNKKSSKNLNLLNTLLTVTNSEEIKKVYSTSKDKIIRQMISSAINSYENGLEDLPIEISSSEETAIYLVSKVIDELLEFENRKFSDIRMIGKGGTSQVYQIGDYVLKLGKPRFSPLIANSKYILQPLVRFYIHPVFIEVQPMLRTTNLDENEVNKVMDRLKREGIDYQDFSLRQFGVLDKPVRTFKMKNGLPLPHQNEQLNMYGRKVGSGELTEDMYEVGKYYILDTDFLLDKEYKNKTAYRIQKEKSREEKILNIYQNSPEAINRAKITFNISDEENKCYEEQAGMKR